MSEKDVRVVVARARIEHAPEIQVVAPKEIRVRANEPLRVQYLYHVEEGSRGKEEWKFMLHSNIGEQQKGPIRSRWADRWGLTDRFWGSLEQTFRFETPGTYAANFQINAEYDRAGWSGKRESVESRKDLAGSFLVHVDP